MIGNTTVATATEMQNNFGRYLSMVMEGSQVIVTRNGREVGRFMPRDAVVSYMSDSLRGILTESINLDKAKEEGLRDYTECEGL